MTPRGTVKPLAAGGLEVFDAAGRYLAKAVDRAEARRILDVHDAAQKLAIAVTPSPALSAQMRGILDPLMKAIVHTARGSHHSPIPGHGLHPRSPTLGNHHNRTEITT